MALERVEEAGDADKPAIVPDTSVIIDGRITQMLQRNELSDVRVLIPQAVLAELEFQANQGRETGFNGLDEIVAIQDLRDVADLDVAFVGDRPRPEHVELAAAGEIDAMIRQVAMDHGAKLITSDRVQAHVARAMGIPAEYLRPIWEPQDVEADISSLEVMQFFDEDTMSVHLKFGVAPHAKKGTPGDLRLVKLSDKKLELKEMTRMRAEIIEAARRDHNSFLEIEREGAIVAQLGAMRIAIAQPPFSDSIEITAVRPVVKLDLEDYDLDPELQGRLSDYQRGIFVSGPPGSGKSTFVTSIAEWLRGKDTVVKTMESPRDLQVSDEITQYAPLERDMELTSDVLLLVRPDFVVYDEVRKTRDFEIFADMRLAGVGLIGVTHANRAIDAVQRLIGRVELGMIPQVVDTVVHIKGGEVEQVMELEFTVKVPQGMQEQDLARPVILVRDFNSGQTEYEIYTYGEQVVVMPVRRGEGAPPAAARDRLAESQLDYLLQRYVQGDFEVELTGENSVTLYLEHWEVPKIIGKGGGNIQKIEGELGLNIDVRPMEEFTQRPRGGQGGGGGGRRAGPGSPARAAEVRPELRKTKKNIVLSMPGGMAGEEVDVCADGEPLFTATVGGSGEVRIKRRSPEGRAILEAVDDGSVVTARVY